VVHEDDGRSAQHDGGGSEPRRDGPLGQRRRPPGRRGAAGISAGPPSLSSGTEHPRTSWITDPDGYRIELVEWQAGHADGMSEADFAGT
jgi:hypothetical protein